MDNTSKFRTGEFMTALGTVTQTRATGGSEGGRSGRYVLYLRPKMIRLGSYDTREEAIKAAAGRDYMILPGAGRSAKKPTARKVVDADDTTEEYDAPADAPTATAGDAR